MPDAAGVAFHLAILTATTWAFRHLVLRHGWRGAALGAGVWCSVLIFYTVAPRARPAAKVRIVELTPAEHAECRAKLDSAGRDQCGADHIPARMRQTGRRMSYEVTEPLLPGLNRVVVPTGSFVDGRKVMPAQLEIIAGEAGPFIYDVPENILREGFPGAKSVRIHFGLPAW